MNKRSFNQYKKGKKNYKKPIKDLAQKDDTL
jgi:hypothetical protein